MLRSLSSLRSRGKGGTWKRRLARNLKPSWAEVSLVAFSGHFYKAAELVEDFRETHNVLHFKLQVIKICHC